jgi:hypothetical protein
MFPSYGPSQLLFFDALFEGSRVLSIFILACDHKYRKHSNAANKREVAC